MSDVHTGVPRDDRTEDRTPHPSGTGRELDRARRVARRPALGDRGADGGRRNGAARGRTPRADPGADRLSQRVPDPAVGRSTRAWAPSSSRSPRPARARTSPEVSRLVGELDADLAAFREHSLAGVRYPYLWVDAQYEKVREGGRVCRPDVAARQVSDGR